MDSNILSKIKILAFDLDGTLLNEHSLLSAETKASLLRAVASGFHVVIATGREYGTVPDYVTGFPGIRYAVTSNGARTIDLNTGASIYENLLTREAIESIMPWLIEDDVMKEIFFDGFVFAEAYCLNNLARYGVSESGIKYREKTRTPCDGVLSLLLENAHRMENINLIFADMQKRARYLRELGEVEGISVVSSTAYNIEIGGATTSKGEALRVLAESLGLGSESVMAFGDNTNDLRMLQAAAVGVAMGNAEPELKEAADWITLPNTEDGVAFALNALLGI
ncbi:MAG TPA: HAD family hydrolase [Bacillota bacterium]|nr:HAD family hydrolase [Bacillota bacterium]HQC35754.1 HAD family hydrolase [Bacillota bacterium]